MGGVSYVNYSINPKPGVQPSSTMPSCGTCVTLSHLEFFFSPVKGEDLTRWSNWMVPRIVDFLELYEAIILGSYILHLTYLLGVLLCYRISSR